MKKISKAISDTFAMKIIKKANMSFMFKHQVMTLNDQGRKQIGS